MESPKFPVCHSVNLATYVNRYFAGGKKTKETGRSREDSLQVSREVSLINFYYLDDMGVGRARAVGLSWFNLSTQESE